MHMNVAKKQHQITKPVNSGAVAIWCFNVYESDRAGGSIS
jgi:hypothetical protein